MSSFDEEEWKKQQAEIEKEEVVELQPKAPVPNPRKPLTEVPKPPTEPSWKRYQQQREQLKHAERMEQRQIVREEEKEEPEPIVEKEPQPTPTPTPTAKQQFYTNDYDEDRELRSKTMPNIYNYGDEEYQKKVGVPEGKFRETLRPVLSTNNFQISDMHIMDAGGKHVIGTFASITIQPHAQVLPLHIQSDEKDHEKQKRIIYEVLFGNGLMCIENLTKPIAKSDLLFVEPNVEHNFFNTTSAPLVVRLWYDGHIDLRDRYFPKARLNEVSKESKREVYNVQTQRREVNPQPREKQRQTTTTTTGGKTKSDSTFS